MQLSTRSTSTQLMLFSMGVASGRGTRRVVFGGVFMRYQSLCGYC